MTLPDFTKYGLFKDAERSDYLSNEAALEINNDQKYSRYCDIANELMFNGGKLIDYNLQPKDESQTKQIYAALRVLLRSFAPPHEVKIATVAKLLYAHCVLVNEDKP